MTKTPANSEQQPAIRTHLVKGQEAFAAGDFVNALKHFVEWANLDNQNLKAREQIAETLHRLGRTDQAVAMYKTVAAAHMATGGLIKAIAIHKTILSLDPNDQEVKSQLLSIFGNKVPQELAGVVKPEPGTPPAAPIKARSAAEPISAADLGLDDLDAPPPKKAAAADELQNVFSELLGEETALKDFKPQSGGGVAKQAFTRTPLFSDLTPVELNALIDQFKLVEIPGGQGLCREGEQSNIMWIIVQGEVDITTQKRDGTALHLATLSEGDFFGEGGFVTGAARTASVTAKTGLRVLEITKNNFDTAAKAHPRMKEVLDVFYHNRLADRAMAQSELFGFLPSFRRAELMQSFQRRPVKNGEEIVREDAPSEVFYLIKTGKIEIQIGGKSVATLGIGEIFGEGPLLTGKPAGFTARAVGAAELLTLKKIDVEGVMQMYPETEPLLKKLIELRSKNNWAKS